jgi:hypothetical protein
MIFHACQASRWTISWNSKPLTNSGLVISSHDTQHVFLFPPRQPQQKILNIVFIWWHGPTGGLKHDIEYVGIALATYLIKITFPSAERSSSNQPWTRFQTLSYIHLNAPFIDLPTTDGMPRYFSLGDLF